MSTLINIASALNPYTTIGGLFAQTANSTPITNTTSELSLIGTGLGSLSIPANSFKVGDSFSVSMWGHLDARNNDDLQFFIKSGTTVLGTVGPVTMGGATAQHWNLEVKFTIRALGGPGVGSIISAGQFSYIKNASTAFEGADYTNVNSFDTTSSNTLNITAVWSAATPLNNIYSEFFVLTKIY